ncbi:hypothetical protein [Spiroplasma endosymbiont of Zeiraphera isertana]|uniref:hypothetical protein n=1 Tax=Spiroplasma endosymbiont of Zeiraphera isertana TaxID=3066313 RepID=UPI00313CD187
MTYSENNPTDPYFIVPEVFNCLRKIKEYPNITGFNLNVLPKRNDFFSNFYSNYGEDSPFTRYVEITNLKSSDPRVEIKKIHQKNIIGTIVDIDTSGIKTDIDNSLWEVDKDNINFVKLKDDKGIDVNGKRIIDVGTPTFLSDATTKVYVDNLLDKKQNKLIAGENIKIDEKTNTISASGGSGESLWEIDPNSSNIIQPKEKRIITSNNTRIVDIADPTQPQDAVNLQTLNKKLEDKMDKDQFQYAFAINTIGTEIPNLETTDKTIAGAINELIDKDFNLTIDKLEPLFDSNVFNIQENKFVVKADFITNILKSAYIKELETTNKSIVDGINELHKRVWKLEGDFVKIQKELIDDEKKMINGNWKEVGTKVNINHIKYTFKSNTKYKIYYNFESQLSNKKFTFMYQEFLYSQLNTDVQTLYWDKVNERIIISLQIQNDTIAIVSDPTRYGQLLKLEELQE